VIGGALVGTELIVPDPEYPAPASARSIGKLVSDKVTVQVQVNRKGMVISAHALAGDKSLRQAAVKAAKTAAFSPEKLADKDKGRLITGTITYDFVAPQTGPSAALRSSPATTSEAGASPPHGSPATVSSTTTGSSTANAGNDSPTTGGPLAGTEQNLPKSQYPPSAKSKGISGAITVVVRVNRAGKVISWRTLNGDLQLRAAALKAARQATFIPAKLPGKGEVVGTITYNFKL
jgi:TonB family protein